MSTIQRLSLPLGLMPDSAAACAWLEEQLAEASPSESLVLNGTWMLEALPSMRPRLQEMASNGHLSACAEYCQLSVHAPRAWRDANRRVAREILDSWDGLPVVDAEEDAEEFESLGEHAGLALQSQALVDRLGSELGTLPTGLVRRALPAASPASLGAYGSRACEDLGRAVLLDLCASLGLSPEDPIESPSSEKLPRRLGELKLGDEQFGLAWRRSRGLRLQYGEAREAGFFATLEVQGDRGGRQGFVAGAPSRPRYFEAGHMTPTLYKRAQSADYLRLERELRLPEDPEYPSGRQAYVPWSLTLMLDKDPEGQRTIEVDVLIENLVPGQRYRLLLPVSSYPRPGVYPIPGSHDLRVREHEGVVAPLPVHGQMAIAGERRAVHVSGAGLREVECYARKNDWLLALTLCRVPEDEDAPRRLRRRFRILFLEVGELDSVLR